jgi:hypothetical protein
MQGVEGKIARVSQAGCAHGGVLRWDRPRARGGPLQGKRTARAPRRGRGAPAQRLAAHRLMVPRFIPRFRPGPGSAAGLRPQGCRP